MIEEPQLSPAPIPLMVDAVIESGAPSSAENLADHADCPHEEQAASQSADEGKECDGKQDTAPPE
jgi:hypothetical protein